MAGEMFVVGSGASGVHFALSLLQKGVNVTMLDVGRQGAAPVSPAATFSELKATLPDPSAYFLGEDFGGVLLPNVDEEYYGIPPSKAFIFDPLPNFEPASSGFAPLFSFARGGLAEAWTGGCYPFSEEEVAPFPFAYRDLAAHYDEVAARIGITGERDDLARFMPVHDHLLPPLRLDRHSDQLLKAYDGVRARLRQDGVYIGRTRVATLSQALESRQPCAYLGRCLWGCPHGALYTPSQTLRECQRYPGFRYLPGFEVDHFRIGTDNRVHSVIARPLDGGPDTTFQVDRLALAAGALLSTRIFLTSILRETGERVRLGGLMDNRQILVPFVNLGMIGDQFSSETYQYHLLGMGLEGRTPHDYVHGQITTLKTALLHPIIQRLPFDLSTSTFIMREVHAALGVVNVNFGDTRRESNYVELSDEGGDRRPRLRIHYEPDREETDRLRDGLKRVRKALRRLSCIVPPGMTHIRPMGASVHYAGTLPMTRDAAPYTTTALGQSREFENLFLVDGTTFPVLPAKNITFTLMANAARIAAAVAS
jgi:choline dehydrogenase-like flavoprotein